MSVCAQCGAVFCCGMVEGEIALCWCMKLPAIPAGATVMPITPNPADAACFCPDCLRAAISKHRLEQEKSR
jgi:hypothetical protein